MSKTSNLTVFRDPYVVSKLFLTIGHHLLLQVKELWQRGPHSIYAYLQLFVLQSPLQSHLSIPCLPVKS